MGYNGYEWEPEYTEEVLGEISSDLRTEILSMLEVQTLHDAQCTCSFCTPMRQLRESMCCQEFEIIIWKAQGVSQ